MNIKILVAAHKPYWMPNDDIYMPIHVGREGKDDIGFIGDNTGDHISTKNPNYCELTAIYWAWKNLDADYIGLVHYRRYFTNKEVRNIESKRKQILSRHDWEVLLARTPVVVGDKRNYYIETNRSHYINAHPSSDCLYAMEDIIKEWHPDYVGALESVSNRTWAHMFNMFVMRRDLYNRFCEWMFPILEEVEKRVDISEYSPYEARVYGFISELMLDIWIEANHIHYEEKNVSFMEKQNWIKKGSKFLWRKFLGKRNKTK